MTRCATTTSLFVLAGLIPCAPAHAQPLGTFRWQLRPYCNVVSLAVVQEHGLYRLEGTDDQCGNGRDLASVTGLAFPNPDGTIGFMIGMLAAQEPRYIVDGQVVQFGDRQAVESF